MVISDFDFSKLSVAVDLGSSMLRGAVGFVDEKGQFNCITTENEPSAGISHGYVKNIADASFAIKNLMKKLTNRINKMFHDEQYLTDDEYLSIGKVYVLLSSSYTQGVFMRIERNLGHKEITKELIDEMYQENLSYAKTNYKKNFQKDFLMAIPQGYEVDGVEENRPIGMFCNHLSVEYQNIIVREDLLEHIRLCFEKVGYADIEFQLSALSTARLVLTEQERNNGTILVNMGAQVMSVSVFYDGILKYIYELHKGCDRINDDLKDLKISAECAEKLKRSLPVMLSMTEPYRFTCEGNDFESEIVVGIIENRVGHLISDILKISDRVNCTSRISKIVYVGGGACLKCLKEKTEITLGIETRIGGVDGFKLSPNVIRNAAVLAGVYCANGGSVEKRINQPRQQPQSTEQNTNNQTTQNKRTPIGRKITKRIMEAMGSLFTDPVDNNNDNMSNE